MENSTSVLIVEGEPQPKQRPRRGKGNVWYTPRESVAYENMIAMLARAEGWKFGTAPVMVSMEFFTDAVPQKRPDLDNLIKAVLDGLQRGNVFKNDRQVIEIHARRWDTDVEKPRAEIRMRSLG